MTMKFINALLILSSSISMAQAPDVSLHDYPDFQSKWPLITVRFREDSGEMRFTWANDLAAKTLDASGSDYPDGSVFAKVSFKSEEDPAFVSSKVPSGTRRAQLMIRDKKKYADTDGWGYFLFDGAGKSVQTNVQACAACHRLVPDRGLVFSQRVALTNLFKAPPSSSLPPLAISESEVVFEEAPRTVIPSAYRDFLPPSDKARRLTKPWLKAAFEGTADEIRPLLTKETLKTKKPSFYLSPDKKVLSWVSVRKGKGSCADKQVPLKAVIIFIPNTSKDQAEVRTRQLEYCAKL